MVPGTKAKLVEELRATGSRCRELVETPMVSREVRDTVRRLCMLSSMGAGEIEALMDQVTCLEEALKPSQEAETKKTATRGKKGDDSKGAQSQG
jgi:hypothetical protein